MPNNPLLLGITGSIGSGKSTVCQLFSVLGIPVYNADNRAKWLISNDLGIREALTSTFGTEAFISGEYNKSFIASIVFQSPEKLKQLNQIIHPAVGRDFEQWVQLNKKNAPYLIKEAALLLNTESGNKLDYIAVVHAPEELRIKRVIKRDPQRSESEIQNIIANQMPQDEMISKADFLIDNSEKKLLIPQVVAINSSMLSNI